MKITKRIISKVPTHILISIGFGFILIQASYSVLIFLMVSLHSIFPNIITFNLEADPILAHLAAILSTIMFIIGLWSISEIIDRI